ncbi:protein-tyrosine-phosphatase IBR5 [Ananas comosus]|uniref:Protein-tyrosine-phosphatase IBR5 n=1 Tax=Ananas comosus TaxID=4615 RepID=A0A6P5FB80_ANACO|nr:protein-tyrosine-phosphatase IBR5 [Ananas comosus]
MRKRERENPCMICGHYHKYEAGEVCGVCGHRMPANVDRPAHQGGGAFPSEILRDFLYLGSYDNASRSELLKTLGISHVLNTVPACQNLYKNSFTYHCLQDEKNLQFDDAVQFLEQCEKEKVRVLVHCMSGKSRSAGIVIAFLMKSKGWRLAQSFQWVKERRPLVDLSSAVQQQLLQYEQRIFGSNCAATAVQTFPSTDSLPSFGFGFPKPPANIPTPAFNQNTSSSIFERVGLQSFPSGFTFGGGRATEQKVANNNNTFGIIPSAGNEALMDSS